MQANLLDPDWALLRPSQAGSLSTGARDGSSEPERILRVLSVSAASQDQHALRSMLRSMHRHVSFAGTCEQALKHLSRGRIAVVLCDHSLPDGSWLDLLEHVSALSAAPPLIVASHLADERMWIEVLNCGGFDLIAKPFRASDVRHVLHVAWRASLDRRESARSPRTLASYCAGAR